MGSKFCVSTSILHFILLIKYSGEILVVQETIFAAINAVGSLILRHFS